MWCDYVKPVRILKRYANNFSHCDEILDRRPDSQVLQDHVSKRIFNRMGITLRSLETYGYIGSKTKSYRILREFLLLFIFYAFWPYKAGLPCFLALWPYKAGLPCFFALWPYKTGFPCFLALWPYKVGLPCFLICFPFCWELLGLCPRADRVPTIPWIITKCFAIHFAALGFFRSNRINHLIRSMCKTLWRRRHPTLPYLLHSASRTIGHFRTRGMIQRRP